MGECKLLVLLPYFKLLCKGSTILMCSSSFFVLSFSLCLQLLSLNIYIWGGV